MKRSYCSPRFVIELFDELDILCTNPSGEGGGEEELDWFRPEEEDY